MKMRSGPWRADKFSEIRGILSSVHALVRDFAQIGGRTSIVAVVYVFAGAVLEGVGISLLVPLLGLLFRTGAIPVWIETGATAAFAMVGAESRESRLFVLLAIFAALMVLRAAVTYVRDIAIFRLQLAFVHAQQMRIANNLATTRWENLAELRYSRVTHLMGGDMQRLGVGIHFVVRGFVASAVFLTQCVLAFILAPTLAAILMVLLVAGVIASGPMLAKARSLGNYVADANLTLLDTTSQFLGGLKLAMSQDLQASFIEEIRQTLHHLSARQLHFAKQYVFSHSGLTALIALAGAVTVLSGLFWFQVAPSVLVALLLVVARMASPIGEMQQAAQQSAHLLAVYENARGLQEDLEPPARKCIARPEAPYPQGDIVFADVSYVHAQSDDERIEEQNAGRIHHLNLTIPEGEFLAVTGASGAGKTTFADLLVGLYPPQSGTILAGGKALEGETLKAWRKGLAYVSQDSFLFHDTVRRNLSWANTDADEHAMWEALAATGADELVRRMENGLDTIVGERGTLVSGGERQRLSLARALLRHPKLLVLDEATNALDAQSEQEVLAALRAIRPVPTIVVIAHRTENLVVCDRVLRLEHVRGNTVVSSSMSAPLFPEPFGPCSVLTAKSCPSVE